MWKRSRSLPAILAAAVAILQVVAAAQGTLRARPGAPATPGQPTRTTSPKNTAIISGVVVAADTGRPVKRARVFAQAAELGEARAGTTRDDGTFEFRDLPPGRYTVTASKTGFANSSRRQRGRE